jgi:hypothetical protein
MVLQYGFVLKAQYYHGIFLLCWPGPDLQIRYPRHDTGLSTILGARLEIIKGVNYSRGSSQKARYLKYWSLLQLFAPLFYTDKSSNEKSYPCGSKLTYDKGFWRVVDADRIWKKWFSRSWIWAIVSQRLGSLTLSSK